MHNKIVSFNLAQKVWVYLDSVKNIKHLVPVIQVLTEIKFNCAEDAMSLVIEEKEANLKDGLKGQPFERITLVEDSMC
jgi:hypothetical protein